VKRAGPAGADGQTFDTECCCATRPVRYHLQPGRCARHGGARHQVPPRRVQAARPLRGHRPDGGGAVWSRRRPVRWLVPRAAQPRAFPTARAYPPVRPGKSWRAATSTPAASPCGAGYAAPGRRDGACGGGVAANVAACGPRRHRAPPPQSYGGYLTAKIVEQDDSHVFSSAISVAPVTDWRFYGRPQRYGAPRPPWQSVTGRTTYLSLGGGGNRHDLHRALHADAPDQRRQLHAVQGARV